VITSPIDEHVGAGKHVTIDASRASRSGRVKVMPRRIVSGGDMASCAKAVSFCPQAQAVRIMTIAATNAFMEHPTLNE
jgi:hypothetical protein